MLFFVLQITSGLSYEAVAVLKEGRRGKKEKIWGLHFLNQMIPEFEFSHWGRCAFKKLHINLKCGIKRVLQFSFSSVSIMDATHFKAENLPEVFLRDLGELCVRGWAEEKRTYALLFDGSWCEKSQWWVRKSKACRAFWILFYMYMYICTHRCIGVFYRRVCVCVSICVIIISYCTLAKSSQL